MPLQWLEWFGTGGMQSSPPTTPQMSTPQMSTPAPMQSQEQFTTPEQNFDTTWVSVPSPATQSFCQQQNFWIEVDR